VLRRALAGSSAPGKFRIEAQRAPEVVDGLLEPAGLLQEGAHGVVGVGAVRIEFEGAATEAQRFLGATQTQQRLRKTAGRRGEIGPELDRAAAARHGRIQPGEFEVQHPETVVCLGKIGSEFQSAPEAHLGLREPPRPRQRVAGIELGHRIVGQALRGVFHGVQGVLALPAQGLGQQLPGMPKRRPAVEEIACRGFQRFGTPAVQQRDQG